jgi:hypothetical protein
MAPSFDVARIGADGRAVIAGRAAPNSKVVLLDGGKEIARGEADARGEWVILLQDPPLASGQHELRAVHHIEGRAPVTSEQVVVAVVPAPSPAPAKMAKATAASGTPSTPNVRRDETIVLLVPPSGAATLMQSPSAAACRGRRPAGVDHGLRRARPGHDHRPGDAGATVRAYLDDKVVAEGKAGPDGRWKLRRRAARAGQHTLRLDRLRQDGKPIARLEMPFERSPSRAPATIAGCTWCAATISGTSPARTTARAGAHT